MKINKLIIIIVSLVLFINFTGSSVFASELPYRLRGRFLIQTEAQGQGWYVDLENGLRHYIPNEQAAFNILSRFGLGISNRDLLKIPIALDSRFLIKDSDNDYLDDYLESAINTDPFNSDSDGDGHPDAVEIRYHFDPLGPGRSAIDLNFSANLGGRILLQVEDYGQAWYVNPLDNLRYYISDGQALLKIISYLGQGINNHHINQITNAALIRDGAVKNIKLDVGPRQRLSYYLDDVKIGSFPISSGKASTPTPRGQFHIINKISKAWSPLGLWMPYWLGLGTGRFGIHELPIWPSGYREGERHLGIPVSNGCVRLGIGPAQFIYHWANVGTPVLIY